MNRPVAAAFLLLLLPFVLEAAEPELSAFEEQMQKVVDAVSPSVVSVVVSHSKEYRAPRNPKPGELGPVTENDLPRIDPLVPRFPRWQPRLDTPHPLDLSASENVADHLFGSGVVLDDTAGLVLVPYHLIEGATKVYVRASGGKGSYADIRAADTKSDLAVLKLIENVPDLKAVKIGDLRLTPGPDGEKPTIKKGAMLVALGHPTAAAVGEGSASVSWGSLSNIRMKSGQPPPDPNSPPDPLKQRPLHQQGGLIQIDARAAFGSTGAAVFNTSGEFVGLGSSVAAVYGSDASGGYAIPMSINYRRVVETLKEGKEVEYGFLGVSPSDGFGGVRVDSVSPGCPADYAGVLPDDIIVAIDGHKLTTTDDLLIHGGGALAGYEVTLDILRAGRPMKLKMTLAKNVNQLPFIATVTPPTPFGIKIDYYSMKVAGGGPRMRFPVTPPQGVIVTDVEAGSPGERALKSAGQPQNGAWMITHVDGKAVTNPKEFYAATAGKKSLKLHLADPDQPTTKVEISLP